MNLPIRVNLQQARASAPLVGALVVQAAAALFFLGETLFEQRASANQLHTPTETIVTLALLIGIALAAKELRRVLQRSNEQASALDILRTTFAQVLKRQFDLWRLTPAERDIATLSLEGLDVEEIRKIRSSATGTVRAQFARIYAKSGVSSRAQFASIFLTELVGRSPQAARTANDPKPMPEAHERVT